MEVEEERRQRHRVGPERAHGDHQRGPGAEAVAGEEVQPHGKGGEAGDPEGPEGCIVLEPEHAEQRAIDRQRDQAQVAVVRLEEVAQVAGARRGAPVVEREEVPRASRW